LTGRLESGLNQAEKDDMTKTGAMEKETAGTLVRSEGDRLRRVIVCAPRKEYFRVDNFEAHNIEAPADPPKAREQHAALRSALRKAGARVINLKELADHPNSVFARDACLVTPDGYVRLRMGLRTRRGEEKWLAAAVKALGIPCAGAIEAPGTVEGGDVILAGRVAFVGKSARTNESGSGQLARLLGKMGYEVRSLRLPAGRLHIGGEMSLAGPKSVLCYGGFFPRGFFEGYDVIEIPQSGAASANIISLGGGAVIVEKRNKPAIMALKETGFSVHALDLSEFVKGRGGPSCLIMPVDRG
jgi:dimethylargininase